MIGLKITGRSDLPMVNIIVIEQLNDVSTRKWLQSHRPAAQLHHTKTEQT